jgi:hypothetical protein
MARRPSPSLADAELTRQPHRASPASPTSAQPGKRTPGRQGKRGVAFWLEPEAFRQLGAMAFEEERSVQSLMEEAVDLMFQSRGKPRIAQRGRSDR